ncbi:DNA pilot protein [Peromfec virus RodF8_42]|uniref:DNA pilot protein n=1 Tax=Peromfec virus RodF8_42 TaxID=2929375 RepID=A0A976R8S4_9VIRU|nr:DNA pilot protein [Peromfec virus RodF8_42]
MVGGIIGAVGNLATGIANTVLQDKYSRLNYQLEKDKFNYQKEYDRTVMQREDNATQRSASDIAAAGGNPALAYSNGVVQAPTSSSSNVSDAPHFDGSGIGNALSSVGGAFNAINQIETDILNRKMINAEIDRVHSDISRTDAETMTEKFRQLNYVAETARTNEEKALAEARKTELLYNTAQYQKFGMPTNTQYPSTMNYFEKTANLLSRKLTDVDDEIGMTYGDMLNILVTAGLFAIPGSRALKYVFKGGRLAPALIRRSYDYIKAHGINGVRKNRKDFVDFIFNGIPKNDKQYKVHYDKFVKWFNGSYSKDGKTVNYKFKK